MLRIRKIVKRIINEKWKQNSTEYQETNKKKKCCSISSSRLFTHLNTCYIYIHRALMFFKSFFIWTNWFFKQLKCYTPKLYFMLWKCKNIFFLFEQSPIESSNLIRLGDLGLRSRLEETPVTTSKEFKSYQKMVTVERIYHAKEKPLNESSVFRLTNCIKKRFQKHEIVFEMLVKKALAYYHKVDRYFWEIGPRRSDGLKIFSCLS